MSLPYKGYQLNEYLNTPWYAREIALFESIIDKLPSAGTGLALPAEHYHNLLTDSAGNINLQVNDDSSISLPLYATGVLSVDGSGVVVTTPISVTAAQVSYTTAYQPTVATVKDALDIIMQTLFYVAPSISSLVNDAGAVYKGQTITDVTLDWTVSGTITAQTLTDATPAVGDRTKVFTGLSLTADKTYTLAIRDTITNPSDTESTTIYFKLDKFYGQSASATPSEAIIEAALAGAVTPSIDVAASRANTAVTQAGGGNYIYYAYPTAWGDVTVYVNGFLTVWNKTTVSVTNAAGNTENYYCYTSDNIIVGSVVISFVAV